MASVIDASTALEVQLKAYHNSGSKVLVDFRNGGDGILDVRVYILEDGLYVPFLPDMDNKSHYASILRRVERVVCNDKFVDVSLSRAFLRNRLIRALAHLHENGVHINKANLEMQLNRLDGRDQILPRFIKAPSVRDVSFEITEFKKTVKAKIGDLSIHDFFPNESQRKNLKEVLVESKREVIDAVIYRDIGVPVDEGDPRLPKKIVEVK